MIGDESALPAIAASLERVRPGVPVEVFIVVDGPADELVLESPGDVTTTWVHREAAPGDAGALLRAVSSAALPGGEVDVFVHGEATEVRAVRRHLLTERGLGGPSISPYWRRDLDDEAWREIKSSFLDEMRRDA
jgi:NADPH-dependent ferric siderophore reductase